MNNNNKNTNLEVSGKDASMKLVESINKRLLQPVKIRHTSPVVCVLKMGKDKNKDIVFGKYQVQPMLVQDILSIANTTKLFKGDDGKGQNASLYIEDAEVRQYLGFESVSENGDIIQQNILSEEEVLLMLKSNKKAFEKELKKFEGSVAKTKLLADIIKRTGYNDAQRIKYIEKFLNITISFE